MHTYIHTYTGPVAMRIGSAVLDAIRQDSLLNHVDVVSHLLPMYSRTCVYVCKYVCMYVCIVYCSSRRDTAGLTFEPRGRGESPFA